ncbi:DoxX family protein [Puia dinghuensis]|uniref:DoxX family protein n=1 Tax=Puia dinghuensis TaxID=1792502 RepID=A0A8J2U830_9BACT|nr:DoxX family protein [Puia dinghuensis]GGA85808.1 hypothetical protein GCM10011511_06070 [Puia dinghuensis]
MNTMLWTSQLLLAAAFLYSGINKTLLSEQQLIARGQTGVAGYSAGAIRFIGVSEILGSIGLILPWWTGIMPLLTPVAAACFAVIMLMAAPIHMRLKEKRNVATNLVLLGLSLFVALERGLQL